jgi:Protein of unknown function (DUF4013)
VDIERALKYQFEDPSWVSKLLIGAVIGLVPIANFAQQGYAIEVIRRVAAHDREPLLAWDDFGRYFVRGAAVALAGLIYTLPAIVIFVLALLAARGAAPAIIVLVLLLLVYFLVVAIVFPLGLTRYALTDSWSGMFDFGWMARAIGAKPGPYVLVLVVSFVVFGVAATVGTMLLGIGSLFTVWVAWLFMSHLLGQFARELGGV